MLYFLFTCFSQLLFVYHLAPLLSPSPAPSPGPSHVQLSRVFCLLLRCGSAPWLWRQSWPWHWRSWRPWLTHPWATAWSSPFSRCSTSTPSSRPVWVLGPRAGSGLWPPGCPPRSPALPHSLTPLSSAHRSQLSPQQAPGPGAASTTGCTASRRPGRRWVSRDGKLMSGAAGVPDVGDTEPSPSSLRSPRTALKPLWCSTSSASSPGT